LIAAARLKDANAPSRVLLIIGSARNDGTCPGEISKSFRLANAAEEILRGAGLDVDRLDLSLLSSDYGRKIHPCKSCVATAMPLCHWSCTCYPNHALGQSDDWMAEIYERWVAAHGVMIVTPVYWGQAPSGPKLMVDQLVCADGGNPDPSSTHGKKPDEAKALELTGWPYPKHLKCRIYGVGVHGDAGGVNEVRASLCDWLDWNGLLGAGTLSQLGRYIGYFEPYATSHDTLDHDEAVVEEVRNVACAIGQAVTDMHEGKLKLAAANLVEPCRK
jgi:multimeric flavodoxin WrbA